MKGTRISRKEIGGWNHARSLFNLFREVLLLEAWRRMKQKEPKASSYYAVAGIYAFFIVALVFYIVVLQQFGFHGLEFQIGGKDNIITTLDLLILGTTVASFALLGISLIAFKRKKDIRIFIISLAFFFFALKEFLFLIDNFFPRETVFIGHAERGLEFLILLSFMMLMYIYRR
ncbi:MAG: hypothetical protein J4469_02130 [Candidatus Aenigmarchaeota archaeon]|nr:hypothetical protein [Candidatus Aenigmarchaeota archaeon]